MLDHRITLAALLLGTLAAVAPASAQTDTEPKLRISAERAELRWSSTGRLLGWLARGAVVERLGGREGWTRARVRGWMRADGLSSIEGGFEIEGEEEPVHQEPNGTAIGGLVEGVDVRRIGGSGDWLRIEMIGWLPDDAVAPVEAAPAPPPSSRPAPAREPAASPSLVGRLSRPTVLRGAPEGGEMARLPAGTVVRAHETRGGWTRVTLEGWVPKGVIDAGGETDVDPEIVIGAPPEAFVGREVAWTLEHVSLQTAEEWRTDLLPGETFGLARVPGSQGLYVYLALPDRLVEPFRGLEPFATIQVEGRVRTGRSGLTGAPILDVTRLHR